MKKLLLLLFLPLFINAQSDSEYNSIYDEFENGNWDQSLNLINNLLSNYPNSAHLHFLKGHVFDKKKNRYSARISFEKAIELNSDHPLANGHLAWIYFNEEKFEDAISVFKQHLSNNSDDLEIVSNVEFNLASCYLNLKNFKEAINHSTNVISINKDVELVARSYWNRGVMKNELRQASGCDDLNKGYDMFMAASKRNEKWGFTRLNVDYMYNSYCDSRKLNNYRFKEYKKEAKRYYKEAY